MSSTPTPPGRIAAIDYGTVRLGIAITDPWRTLASPWESYTRRGPDQDRKRMQQLVAEERIAQFVVGLPIHLDGRESRKSTEARQFARWLAEATGVAVELFDERFTTNQAEQLLGAAQLTSKRRKQRVDMLAAQIILTAYLESSEQSRRDPGPLD